MAKKSLLFLICSSFLVLCGTVLYKKATTLPQTQHPKSFTPTYDLGGDFSLIDTNGAPFSSENLKGSYSLIYFGYSFCPDICPMGLICISEVLEKLTTDKDKVKAYFITIDPKRDTKQKLALYKENYHPLITMLTGSELEVDKAIKDYKVYKQLSKERDTVEYLLDHSSLIYVLDKNGAVVQVFSHTEKPETILKALQELMIKSY